MITYKIARGTNLDQIPVLPYMLRLMMGLDAMKASIRWLYLLSETDSPSEALQSDPPDRQTDRLINMITSAGWAGETLHRIQEGHDRGWIRREMLIQQTDLLKLWDDLFATSKPRVIRKVFRIRDKYFAHWDDKNQKIAKEFIAGQAGSEKSVEIMTTTEDGDFLKTTFPWAFMAIVRDLTGGSSLIADFESVVGEIAPLVGMTCRLVDQLLAELCDEHSIWLERTES